MTELMHEESTTPDVSVLVMAYNHAPSIAECLDGILAQDYSGGVEIIVGEDCSTDDTAVIVAEYARRYSDVIRVLTTATNVGMHANNRRLIHAARGRYIAYCEGDDFWHRPDKLRMQVALLDAEPDAVGVHSDVDHLMAVGGEVQVHEAYWASARPEMPDRLAFCDLVASNSVQTCSVVLRTSILSTYADSPFANGMYPMEDWPMFLHVLESGDLLYIRESLATYRHVPGSATRQEPARMVPFLQGERRLVRDAAARHPECGPARLEGLVRTREALVRIGLMLEDHEVIREALASGRSDGLPENTLTRLARTALALSGGPRHSAWTRGVQRLIRGLAFRTGPRSSTASEFARVRRGR